MGALQPWHLIIILVIALIVFGPGKLTGIGHELGTSIRDFRKAFQEDEQPKAEAQSTAAQPTPAQSTPTQVAPAPKAETSETKPGGTSTA
jgi:sec-independent protein translocase protein TatA